MIKTFLLSSLCGLLAVTAAAQENVPSGPPAADKQVDVRANVLRQLGLSRDQLMQIRRLNQDRKPLIEDAQRRLRLANRALDESIYSETASEPDIQARLKDFQLAQAEVSKIRFTHEYAVRKILTPDQLTRFRDFRHRFERSRESRIMPDSAPPSPKSAAPFRPMVRQDMKNVRP